MRLSVRLVRQARQRVASCGRRRMVWQFGVYGHPDK